MMLPQEGRILLAARTSAEQEIWQPCETGWLEDTLKIRSTDVSHPIVSAPRQHKLAQNYPNPFNARTTIEYELINNAMVELSIFNLRGEKVTELIRSVESAGNHSVSWDGIDETGRPASSGLYYYLLKADDKIFVKRMTLIK